MLEWRRCGGEVREWDDTQSRRVREKRCREKWQVKRVKDAEN